MATDAIGTYASVPTTLGTAVVMSGAGALGGLLGTGSLATADGDTSGVHIVNHIPADGSTVYDSFAYPVSAIAMPPGRPCVAVSFHFSAKVGTGTPDLNIGFGKAVTDSTTWGAGTATTVAYPVPGTSYALHEQPFDAHAADETSLLLWATDRALVTAMLAGTCSVILESATAAAHTATINVSSMQVRAWYANTAGSLYTGAGRITGHRRRR